MTLVRDYDPVTGQPTYREQLDRPKAAFTTTQRDALRGVQLWTGRIIYNTTTGGLEFYNGTAWGPLVVTPPTWTAVTFQNSWVDFGASNQTVQYCKIGDRVYVRGAAKSGTIGATMFTLPVGFRPPAILVFDTMSNGAFGYIVVGTAGNVDATVGSNVSMVTNFDFSVTA